MEITIFSFENPTISKTAFIFGFLGSFISSEVASCQW